MKKSILIFICGLFLIGCSNEQSKTTEENWEESPTLIREVIVTDDGQTEDFIFRIGDNGKLGFGEYGPFVEGELQKYMWHFWGEQDILTQPFKVIGISGETDKNITVFEYTSNNSLAPNTGADHHIPSSMMLPNAGVWKLEAYFGEELFGSVIVNVEN